MIKIEKAENCSGCHACYSVCPKQCISMVSDEEGFWYPKIDDTICINCRLCERVCPILHSKPIQNQPKAYACFNLDKPVRKESSSGGVFTLLGKWVISQGGVVFGAKFDDSFRVVHGFIENQEDLNQFRGSKYVQSLIGDVFKQVKMFLEQDRFVLFSGTPCQTDGLRAYLQHDYPKLFVQDIVCHGMPSPLVWQHYLDWALDGKTPKSVTFRNKDRSWVNYQVKIDTEYGIQQEVYRDNLFMKAFLSDICLRPSCSACHFKSLHRQSDLTLADFWGIQNVVPELFDDRGTSLVLVNSEKGGKLFEAIKQGLIYKEVDIQRAVQYNPSAYQVTKANPKRADFFNALENMPFDKALKKYVHKSVFRQSKAYLKRILRKLLS